MKKSKSLTKTQENKPVKSKELSIMATDIESLGSPNDPCFGTQYDLTTEECKMCGDSEICAIKFAASMKITRKRLEEENKYKDIENLIDEKAVFKSIRTLKRKGIDRSEILDRVQAKYELSREDAKTLYRKYKEKHQEK